jgi:PAS domain S-box-containing protein
MWETILSGKEWRGKFQNRKKDGSLFWVSAQISPIVDDACEILNFLALEEDITHQKEITEALTESEDRYRRLVEHSPDAIAVYSDGAFAFVNPAAVQLFGAQYESQLIGKQIVNFIQPESRKFAQERIQAILENEKPLPIVEEKYLKVDGTAIDVEVASLPILLGKKSAVQVIIRDITEKKKIQSQLLQTQKVESIGTLAGGIAHDFNNILGIVVAYTSILQRVEGDKKKFENSIDAINKAVSRGAALVRQILTFARQTEISIKQMSVPELAHEVVTMLQETFPKLIEFKEVFERGIPLINADHSQIHQAVLNLCVNARDAMPQGGVITVKIDVRPLEEVKQRFPTASFNRYVRLSISDTGTGMNESTKKRIFDPFFTTKELGKGTGLGLSVVYGVMQSHYGFVSVESEFGQGTTFYLFLPVPQEIKKDHGEPVSKGIGTHRGTETILFVEDEELLRTAVASTLESNGYTVHVAVDGRQAVEVYKQYRKEIELVITDMGLPKLSGMDVFLQLREINPTLKIILASGFIPLEQKTELLKAGASEFIQKPYLLSEVLEKIRGALNEKNE